MLCRSLFLRPAPRRTEAPDRPWHPRPPRPRPSDTSGWLRRSPALCRFRGCIDSRAGSVPGNPPAGRPAHTSRRHSPGWPPPRCRSASSTPGCTGPRNFSCPPPRCTSRRILRHPVPRPGRRRSKSPSGSGRRGPPVWPPSRTISPPPCSFRPVHTAEIAQAAPLCLPSLPPESDRNMYFPWYPPLLSDFTEPPA